KPLNSGSLTKLSGTLLGCDINSVIFRCYNIVHNLTNILMKNIIIIILILILISLGIYYALRIETNDISSTTSTAPTDVINTKLDLSNKELTEVPIYVFDEEQLIELNLSFNQLGGSIPSEINSLTKLERLD